MDTAQRSLYKLVALRYRQIRLLGDTVRNVPRGSSRPIGVLTKAVVTIVADAVLRSGVSQQKLGAEVDISQSSLSKKLRCEIPITIDELEALCRWLNLDIVGVIATAAEEVEPSE